jgi:putative phosphoesterase
MLIGILSDTHDRVNAMAAAIQLLQEHHAEYFIHCGDVGGEAVLDHLAGLAAAFVWGNNDWDRKSLEAYAERLGIKCLGAEGELELGGKRVVVMHGDDFAARQRVLAGQSCDYLLEGHTHVRKDEHVGTVRCINPGALYRARQKTVALLDTAMDQLTFLQVPGV